MSTFGYRTTTSSKLSGTKRRTPSTTDENEGLPVLPPTLRVLSFNVAMLKPSQAAAASWDPVRAFQDEISSHSPDILCLQEVPMGQAHFLQDKAYYCVGTKESHCGSVTLLVKEAWVPYVLCTYRTRAPAVLAKISFANQTDLIVGSCHLEPYAEGSTDRYQQVQYILDAINDNNNDKQPPVSFILGGDFNMRQKEDANVEGLGLADCWKETGAHWQHKFTWDSRDYSAQNKPSNKYHGDDAFGFTARYDRIYLGGGLLKCQNFKLIANQPMTKKNPTHFLSDHFGIIATIATPQKKSLPSKKCSKIN